MNKVNSKCTNDKIKLYQSAYACPRERQEHRASACREPLRLELVRDYALGPR